MKLHCIIMINDPGKVFNEWGRCLGLQSGDDILGRLNGIFSETEVKESKIYAWVDLHFCQI